MASVWKTSLFVVFAAFALMCVNGSLGGWRDTTEDDTGVQEALMFATTEYNSGSNGEYIVKVHRTIRLRKKVVAGMKYSMDVEVVMTPCSDFETKSKNCSTQKKRCRFEVLTVPWQKITKLEKKSCYPRANQ
ncbi:hypothetical protein GDO86_009310 [Hymenochirus boettgeri]|uniref:Cystatin domain-containing protein n=1 Tax=Hymenochirus boettgeri TaxID=247094 RepID=A0A8T2JL68_9PIPI|nr:hypothetical protein GDO86_009310 [Hymenochirus boettgeri]